MERPPTGALNASTELRALFPVPFLQLRWPDHEALNRELRGVILEKARGDRGIKVSNVSGWHSEKDFHVWDAPCVRRLVECCREAVADMVRELHGAQRADLLEGWELECWANVNRKGAYNRSHRHDGHPANVWSGVYYVTTGVAPGAAASSAGGVTKFENRSLVPVPVPATGRLAPLEHTVVPEPGLMVLFPATLRHYVETYHGEGERITVGFNCRHPGFGVARYPDMLEPNWRWKNFRGLMVCYAWVENALRQVLRGSGAGR